MAGQIYITGDKHGTMRPLFGLAEKNELGKEDVLIITGDAGFVWDEIYPKTIATLEQAFPGTTVFVDGNHENHDLINAMEIMEWNGGRVHRVGERVFHLMRGEVYSILGQTIFTFGGGVSSDLQQIMDSGSWSERELPTEEEMLYGVNKLKGVNCEVDYIITHETSATYKHKIWRNCTTNPMNDYLESLQSEVRFDKWFFGNLHIDFAISESVFSVFEEIVPIDSTKKS